VSEPADFLRVLQAHPRNGLLAQSLLRWRERGKSRHPVLIKRTARRLQRIRCVTAARRTSGLLTRTEQRPAGKDDTRCFEQLWGRLAPLITYRHRQIPRQGVGTAERRPWQLMPRSYRDLVRAHLGPAAARMDLPRKATVPIAQTEGYKGGGDVRAVGFATSEAELRLWAVNGRQLAK
jgi:hypothetical protein